MKKNKQNNYWIITGEVNQGKTTFTKNLVKQLVFNNVNCNGIITDGVFDYEEKNNYYVSSIDSNNRKKLCSTNVNSSWIKYRRFYFNPHAIEFGNSLLHRIAEDSQTSKIQVAIVDEIGHLEINNDGWYNGIVSLVKSNVRNQIWVVRKSLVESVCNKFQIEPKQIIDVGEESSNLFIDTILNSISGI